MATYRRCACPIVPGEKVPAVADTAGRSDDAGDAFANEEIVLGDHQPHCAHP